MSHARAQSLDVVVSSQCAAAVDNLAGFYFKAVQAAAGEAPSPTAQARPRPLRASFRVPVSMNPEPQKRCCPPAEGHVSEDQQDLQLDGTRRNLVYRKSSTEFLCGKAGIKNILTCGPRRPSQLATFFVAISSRRVGRPGPLLLVVWSTPSCNPVKMVG